MKNKTKNGRYVRFSFRPDRLRIFLLPEGRAYLREVRVQPRQHGHRQEPTDLELFRDLIEDFLYNGWEEVLPEQVGDLRDENWLVISDDCVSTDPDCDDELIVGTAYGYNDYAIHSYIDPLVSQGYLDFQKHVYLEPREMKWALARCRPDLFEFEHERERLLQEAEHAAEFRMLEAAGQLTLAKT